MKTNILTWLVPFILGGFLTFSVLGLRAGEDVQTMPSLPSLTPVADKLNAYSCRVAETKQIVLGGREDGFSLEGEELNTPGEFAEYQRSRTGSKDSINNNRGYDVGGQDSAFLESFNLPDTVAHGLIVMRLRPLSSLRNDYVSIGGLLNGHLASDFASFGYSDPDKNPGWEMHDELLFAELGNLKNHQRYAPDKSELPRKFDTVLEYIQHSGKKLDIIVSDDTMVDVVGFAMCLKPETGKGVTFLVNPLGNDLVSVTCNSPTGENHCSLYKGDTVCETELPVACFADLGYALPNVLKNDPTETGQGWSSGDVKFTEPMRGDTFSSQREGNAFCKKTFGEGYRLANIHDGAQATGFVAYGGSTEVTQAWVDSNLEPYANCWSMREQYPEETRDE